MPPETTGGIFGREETVMQINKQALREIIPDSERLLFRGKYSGGVPERRARPPAPAQRMHSCSRFRPREVSGGAPVRQRKTVSQSRRVHHLVGSTIPLFGGIILDVIRHEPRVLERNRDTMTITVEPGMLLKDLQAYVEETACSIRPIRVKRPRASAATSAPMRAACVQSSTA